MPKRISKTREYVKRARRHLHKALTEAVLEAMTVMDELVPEDKGDLRSTISSIDFGLSFQCSVGGTSRKTGKNVDYAAHVEFGTVHTSSLGKRYVIAAQPYFRPAIAAGKTKLKQELKNA